MAFDAVRWRIAQAVRRSLLATSETHTIRRAYLWLRASHLVQYLWRLIDRDGDADWLATERYAASGGIFAESANVKVKTAAASLVSIESETFYDDLLARIATHEPRDAPVPRRAVLINNGLSAGGAERQIVYTLTGLAKRGWDARFIGEHLLSAPGLAFHLETLRRAGIQATPLPRKRRVGKHIYATITRPVADVLSRLPAATVLEILDMVAALRQACPAVVHLWQDETSTKHAISAFIAGVPRIILSGRNLDPTHFAYHRPHMRGAYRALAKLPSITLSNNSCAGARSYAAWLDLDPSIIRVVHNGVDTKLWPTRSHTERAAWRRTHQITETAPVVVGAFRLAAEKRPLLWLEVAAQLRVLRSDARFVLIGDGPLRDAVKARVLDLSLTDALILLGEVKDVSLPISCADVFLLTSAQEGLPNVLLESQWYGRPCLTTDAGGAREAIHENVTGLIAVNDDANALANALYALLNDDILRTSAITDGPRFIERQFGVDRMIDETLALYDLG